MTRLTYRHLVFLLFIFGSYIGISQLEAQNKQLTQKEQKQLLKKANAAYKGFKYSIAAGYFENYLKTVPDSSNALFSKLADCYWQIREYNDALRIYKLISPNASTGNQGATKQQHLRMAELYARSRDYKHASQWLKGIDGYQSKSIGYNDSSKLKDMRKDSLNWHLGLLDINTSFRDFSPFVADSILFFSSDRPNVYTGISFDKPGNNYDRLWKVSVSKIHATPLKMINSIMEGKYNPSGPAVGKRVSAKSFNSNVNTFPDNLYGRADTNKIVFLVKGMENIRYNIGAVSVDKNNHFYFSANYPNADRRGINRLRLMEGFFNSKGSMTMKALPFGNPRLYTVMHPAVNRDGTFLVLSSDKPNGKGNYDLYYTQRKSIHQAWDSLKTFGNNINTVGNEVFPTITTNGYLYYSSDAMPGLGGLDIFRIPLQDALDGKGIPEHLSYPINSSGDDFGWTQDTTTVNGYFTSDRLNNNNDIFSFFYKNYQKMCSISGSVLNLFTKEPIMNATVFILNKGTKKVNIAKTDKNGKYNFILASTDTLILKAVKIGLTNDFLTDRSSGKTQQEDTVLKNTQNLLLEKRIVNVNDTASSNNEKHASERSGTDMQNLLLNKHILLINANWKLNNIYYNFNKWNIRTDAAPILDSLISLLKMYPIRVELGSHTDSRGTFEYNDWLSQRRAEAVVDYLVKHGINKNRVIAIGYGKRFLLNQCTEGMPCRDSEHQVNRRTEVKVISNTDIQKYQIDAIDPNQFKDGEQINQSALPADFFDNCDKFN